MDIVPPRHSADPLSLLSLASPEGSSPGPLSSYSGSPSLPGCAAWTQESAVALCVEGEPGHEHC